ncbi:MAG: restriction endonuclease subunit S [Pseudomonadota bacterium]
MAGEKHTSLVPKLRFPGFANDPFREARLRDVTSESRIRNGEEKPKFDVMGVSKRDGIIPMEERLIASDASRYKIVRKDWFAYNPMRLNIGSIARWGCEKDVLVSPDYVVFQCDTEDEQNGLLPDFFEQFRQSDVWDAFVNEAGDGGVRVRIYYDNIGEIKLGLPSLPEQQEIADCLGSLDDLIAGESSKLDALRKHKKGLMKQLLPQPGETVPRLRFPEFKDAGEWEETTIASRCTSFSGGTPATSKNEYYGGEISFIRSAEIGENTTELTITKDGLENSSAKLVKEGDLLVALYGANSGDVALCRFAGAINQAILCLRSSARVSFLHQFLLERKSWILQTYLQGGQGNLSGKIIMSVPIVLPKNDEQKRIAECLEVHDALIASQSLKVANLKQLKRGLLQQLFPFIKGNER